MLEPFGEGNPQPVFMLENVRISEVRSIGEGRHTRFKTEGGVGAVYFGRKMTEFEVAEGGTADIAARVEYNSFAGGQAQLIVCDMHPCAKPGPAFRRGGELYDRLCAEEAPPEQMSALCPSRGELETVWRRLKSAAADGVLDTGEDIFLCAAAGVDAMPEVCARILICLKVFGECGLIELKRSGGRLYLRLCDRKGKAELDDSRLFVRLKTAKQHGI